MQIFGVGNRIEGDKIYKKKTQKRSQTIVNVFMEKESAELEYYQK